ncbi:MAG: hypothetical protein AB3N16_09715 [Flavobacteriaceae bacterium]
MSEKIKLIWDFKGPTALQTALHHEKHLKEFIEQTQYPLNITGHHALNEMHSLAFMVVKKDDMIKIRDILRPHRGEIHAEP